MTDNIPRDLHGLRACLLCHLIKHADQFEKNGCENCESYLGFRNNRDIITSCTTANFSGIVGLCQPEDSWVARWQRFNKRVRGMYAISVAGKIPAGIAQDLKDMGH